MPLLGRPDGQKIKNLSTLRRFMPFLMPGRNEAVVYFQQTLDLSRTLPWLEAVNADRDEEITFFHVLLCALVRTLHERPRLNRFIAGRRVYQRNEISLAFAVKKSFEDEAPITSVKIVFEPDDDLETVGRRIREAVGQGRDKREMTSETEMRVLGALPRSVLSAIMGLQRWLDYWNLLPWAMIKDDPLYSSLFLANLGSIGLDAPFHHLFEYGTVPIFACIGRIKKAPIVDANHQLAVGDVVDLRFSLDERIADGFYCARSLERFQAYVEDPQTL